MLSSMLTPDPHHNGSGASPDPLAAKAAARLRPLPGYAPAQHRRLVRPATDYPSPASLSTSPARARRGQLSALPRVGSSSPFEQLQPAAELVSWSGSATTIPPCATTISGRRPARPALRTVSRPARSACTARRALDPAAYACAAGDAPRGPEDDVDAGVADDAGPDIGVGCDAAGVGAAAGQ